MNNVRETGVIIAVKDAFGFIRCADRDDKLFFHFTSLMNLPPNHDIERGDEVSFSVRIDPETNRMSATQVLILPPGTVVFEEMSDVRSRGLVERELQINPGPNGTIPDEPFGGRIHAEPSEVPGINPTEIINGPQGPYVLLEFSGRDIDDPQNTPMLIPGDIVEFQLFTEKRSGRQGATNIRLIQQAERNANLIEPIVGTERENGIVVCVKESFGFIRCLDRDQKQMFFHFSELATPNAGIHPGAEVSFFVGTNKKSQMHATSVVLLEPGTLTQQKVDTIARHGVVSIGVPPSRGPKAKRHEMGNIEFLDSGTIQMDEDVFASSQSAPVSTLTSPIARPDGKTRTLSFPNNEVADPRLELLPGDKVEFKIATHTRTRATSATEVTLLVPSPIGRERGLVNVLKQQFGFIKCELRPDPLFFHFSEILDTNATLAIGDEVEFNVYLSKDQPSASRITILPPGSVQFNTIDLQGTVLQEPGTRSTNAVWGRSDSTQSSSSVSDFVPGSLKLSPESLAEANCSTDTFLFGPQDFLVGRTSLRAGDEVAFAFLTDETASGSRISMLRLLPKAGVVETTFSNGGYIALGDEIVSYSQSDVNGALVLRTNDEVLVNNLTFNARKKQRVARSIERTKEAPASNVDEAMARKVDQLSMQPRQSAVNPTRVRQITRMAQGPDGTTGFMPGSRSGL